MVLSERCWLIVVSPASCLGPTSCHFLSGIPSQSRNAALCVQQEVLKQLQGTIEEESGEASGSQLELIERLKGEENWVGPLRAWFWSRQLPHRVLPSEMSLDPAGFRTRTRAPPPPSSSSSSGPNPAAFPRRGAPTAGREGHDRCLEELEKEKSLLLAELEKEEKEKDWYYAQLQNLTKRIDSLPLTENFTLQTDMSRRQLEFEARQIRSAMEEQLGSCQEMERRAQKTFNLK
uniref:Adenomatous polyposis coli N-terminal dimerisation domain-containing protein n=1 Tax=Xiphophorus couchianus TaxID=32473 RepID=A0A3B5KSH2_9TELE